MPLSQGYKRAATRHAEMPPEMTLEMPPDVPQGEGCSWGFGRDTRRGTITTSYAGERTLSGGRPVTISLRRQGRLTVNLAHRDKNPPGACRLSVAALRLAAPAPGTLRVRFDADAPKPAAPATCAPAPRQSAPRRPAIRTRHYRTPRAGVHRSTYRMDGLGMMEREKHSQHAHIPYSASGIHPGRVGISQCECERESPVMQPQLEHVKIGT